MVKQWRQFEGAALEGKYVIRECLSDSGVSAVFAAEPAGGGARHLLRLTSAAEIAGFPHPNLLSLLDSGNTEMGGLPLVYTVSEWPEENLADVLRERALTTDEARHLLTAVLNGLNAIHERGFLHGEIRPENVFAVGDTVKLAADVLRRRGAPAYDSRPPGPYDAPEIGETGASVEADIWSLGVTVCETLTQERRPALEDLPEPFREIVANCLRPEPAARWSLERIRARLLGETPAPIRKRRPVLPYVAAAAGLLFAGAILVRSFRAERVPTQPAQVAARATSPPKPSPYVPPARERPARERSSPIAPPAVEPPSALSPAPAARPYWRVVAYTFSRLEHAEQRVRSVNQRWPDFQAEVFTAQLGRPPYLVAIGGRMTREQAAALRDKARGTGLPRDTYIQNYSR